MLTTDPVIQAGVLATRECMIPGRARIKHSVQCFLRELMREWPTDESEDLTFSITVASKRLGVQAHGEPHSFESAGCPKEPCAPEPDSKQHKRSSKKGE